MQYWSLETKLKEAAHIRVEIGTAGACYDFRASKAGPRSSWSRRAKGNLRRQCYLCAFIANDQSVIARPISCVIHTASTSTTAGWKDLRKRNVRRTGLLAHDTTESIQAGRSHPALRNTARRDPDLSSVYSCQQAARRVPGLDRQPASETG